MASSRAIFVTIGQVNLKKLGSENFTRWLRREGLWGHERDMFLYQVQMFLITVGRV